MIICVNLSVGGEKKMQM